MLIRRGTRQVTGEPARVDLSDHLAMLADGMGLDDPYRPPTRRERRTAAHGLEVLLGDPFALGEAASRLAPHGFRVADCVDTANENRFVLVDGERRGHRRWGTVVLDPHTPPSSLIAVPHPSADLDTEIVGAELFRRTPGAVLLVSGSHRRTADEAGDVAHRTDSLFHAFALRLMDRGLPQIQLHGFASLSDVDVVLSPGPGEAAPALLDTADALDTEGFRLLRSWLEACPLTGRTNVQGRAAADHDLPFLHVELARALRSTAETRGRAMDAIASATCWAGDSPPSTR